MKITIISKKAIIIALSCILIPVLCISACAGAVAGVTQAGGKSFFYGTVVVDAGHGGRDGGGVGSAGVKESDINLAMARLLKSRLEEANYRVVMTRENENALSNIKRIDMQMRKEIILSSSPLTVISLHVNRFSDSARRGVQVFYDDTKVGKDFAEAMQAHLNKTVNAKYGGRDDYEAIAGDLFITKCAPVPSIIIECGFISNAEDEKLLLDEAYRKELCSRIAELVAREHNPE